MFMQFLIDYIKQFTPLNNDAITALYAYASFQHYKKNQLIIRLGQRCDYIWFLKSGMVRKYYLHEGKEITSWIHSENQIFTSLNSYAQQSPSEEYIQAYDDVELIGISRDNSKKLAVFPQIVQFTNEMMEKEFINIETHTKALKHKDAKAKYDYLFEIAPEIIKRAKLIHIASILNLTPETISRIRKLT